MKILTNIIGSSNIAILFSKEIVQDVFSLEFISAGFLTVSFAIQLKEFKAKCFGQSSFLNHEANSLGDKQITDIYLNELFFSINNLG